MKEVVERESVATGITMEVEELQRQNQDSFRVRSECITRCLWRLDPTVPNTIDSCRSRNGSSIPLERFLH
jgi:hypothetical protein